MSHTNIQVGKRTEEAKVVDHIRVERGVEEVA
jgi:hypothetical protein